METLNSNYVVVLTGTKTVEIRRRRRGDVMETTDSAALGEQLSKCRGEGKTAQICSLSFDSSLFLFPPSVFLSEKQRSNSRSLSPSLTSPISICWQHKLSYVLRNVAKRLLDILHILKLLLHQNLGSWGTKNQTLMATLWQRTIVAFMNPILWRWLGSTWQSRCIKNSTSCRRFRGVISALLGSLTTKRRSR